MEPRDLVLLASLRDRDLRREGLVVAEGRLLVERLLAAPDFEPLVVAALPALAPELGRLAAGRCPLRILSEPEMAALAGFPFHRGALAAARRPAARGAGDWLAGPGALSRRLLVLPATADPENLGALLRSAAALGFEAALLGPGCADRLGRRALRASMGAALVLPAFEAEGPGLAASLRAAGIEAWAAVLGPGAVSLADWSPPGRLALVLGPEFEGLDPAWREACAGLVTVPMSEGPDSLNVAAAGAILMWETSARKRRPSLAEGAPGA